MRRKSEGAVLRTLLTRGEATRGELIAALGLSRPTVERAVRHLIHTGLVRELGPRPSLGGRPAIAYSLHPQARLIAGVDLELPWVNLVLSDLLGAPIAQHRFRLTTTQDPTYVLGSLAEELSGWVEGLGYRWHKVAAVGIGVPGPVVRGEVSVLGPTLPTWLRVPAQEMLARQLQTLVYVSHDVHLMALAEGENGGWGDEILLFLALRPGLEGEVRFGASVLLRGEPHWGAHGNGGGLYRAFVPAEELSGLPPKQRALHLAERLVERALPAVILVDPHRVIVEAGALGGLADRFLQHFQHRLRSSLRGELPTPPRVGLAKSGELGVALGAALAARRELIKHPEYVLNRGEVITGSNPEQVIL
ncbi:MAG TPA: ROK family transcriptional regulator [Candidatus Acetothermia bacterium]|nr:ROK family transcriptional regulator [Candidatus Acetothermia bacterium]